jgi:hypothetical protein
MDFAVLQVDSVSRLGVESSRASMVFGRCFERALESYFRREDSVAALYREWGAFRGAAFEFKRGETWDRILHQGVHLLERFAQDDRIRIPQANENLQIKVMRELPNANQFVSYIEAIGSLDGVRCLMDWKTTTSRYSEEPNGLLSLDPQLICYSWATGISEVAMVVFVRKHQPEIQYLGTSISEEQRAEFGYLVASTIHQIETVQFPPHNGIRFPQNGCVSCPHLGLCLDDRRLIDSSLIRSVGASDLAWLDELMD